MPNIALVLSGAVSLGSWEAGVLDELLFQLDRLNTDRSGEDRFVLDVITGASAGALTGALVARAVMVDFAERAALRNAWVDEIDIGRLLDGPPPNALLSRSPVAEIARKHMVAPESVSPSSMAPSRLLMRFMLTNMSGVDYELVGNDASDPGSERFTSTFHAERREFVIDESTVADEASWTRLREAAVASGSFPFAFAPKALPSDEWAWPGHAWERLPERFTYLDGGIFNNEPLGEAVTLARKLDTAHGHVSLDPSRLFLLVDAGLNGSTHDPTFGEDAALSHTAFRLLGVLLGESSALDWLKARRLNNELEWRDDFVATLADMMRTAESADFGAFAGGLGTIADHIVEQKRARFPARYRDDYRERAVARTLARYADLTAEMTDRQREAFGTLTFVLNSVSGLDKKEFLNLYVLYTTPTLTAGDQIHAFAGFFSAAWRQHDYAVGRRAANEELAAALEGGGGPYPREPGVDYDPAPLGAVTMAHAPRAPRVRVRDTALAKVGTLADAFAVGPRWLHWLTRPALRWVVQRGVRSKLNALLEL